MTAETLIVETRGRVGLIRLNRPQALNALSNKLIAELEEALDAFEADDSIGAIVLTGDERAFAAGADIKEMKDKTFMEAYLADFITKSWERTAQCRKPVIAAVAGFALGGGCELAMMCDFIIAAENAVFGQPEITIGIIPGAGGTQRLARLLGTARALDLILHATLLAPAEALALGVVHRVFPAERFREEARAFAQSLAERAPIALAAAKRAIRGGAELPLAEGLALEQEQFERTMRSQDAAGAMRAFLRGERFTWKGE
jgi:enoyl-CoA hydratase